MRCEKYLELVTSCGCSGCNWSPWNDIKKIERLDEKVKYKELHRAFAKSSIAHNCKKCKASPRDLRLLGTTCSLSNLPELPTKTRLKQ